MPSPGRTRRTRPSKTTPSPQLSPSTSPPLESHNDNASGGRSGNRTTSPRPGSPRKANGQKAGRNGRKGASSVEISGGLRGKQNGAKANGKKNGSSSEVVLPTSAEEIDPGHPTNSSSANGSAGEKPANGPGSTSPGAMQALKLPVPKTRPTTVFDSGLAPIQRGPAAMAGGANGDRNNGVSTRSTGSSGTGPEDMANKGSGTVFVPDKSKPVMPPPTGRRATVPMVKKPPPPAEDEFVAMPKVDVPAAVMNRNTSPARSAGRHSAPTSPATTPRPGLNGGPARTSPTTTLGAIKFPPSAGGGGAAAPRTPTRPVQPSSSDPGFTLPSPTAAARLQPKRSPSPLPAGAAKGNQSNTPPPATGVGAKTSASRPPPLPLPTPAEQSKPRASPPPLPAVPRSPEPGAEDNGGAPFRAEPASPAPTLAASVAPTSPGRPLSSPSPAEGRGRQRPPAVRTAHPPPAPPPASSSTGPTQIAPMDELELSAGPTSPGASGRRQRRQPRRRVRSPVVPQEDDHAAQPLPSASQPSSSTRDRSGKRQLTSPGRRLVKRRAPRALTSSQSQSFQDNSPRTVSAVVPGVGSEFPRDSSSPQIEESDPVKPKEEGFVEVMEADNRDLVVPRVLMVPLKQPNPPPPRSNNNKATPPAPAKQPSPRSTPPPQYQHQYQHQPEKKENETEPAPAAGPRAASLSLSSSNVSFTPINSVDGAVGSFGRRGTPRHAPGRPKPADLFPSAPLLTNQPATQPRLSVGATTPDEVNQDDENDVHAMAARLLQLEKEHMKKSPETEFAAGPSGAAPTDGPHASSSPSPPSAPTNQKESPELKPQAAAEAKREEESEGPKRQSATRRQRINGGAGGIAFNSAGYANLVSSTGSIHGPTPSSFDPLPTRPLGVPKKKPAPPTTTQSSPEVAKTALPAPPSRGPASRHSRPASAAFAPSEGGDAEDYLQYYNGYQMNTSTDSTVSPGPLQLLDMYGSPEDHPVAAPGDATSMASGTDMMAEVERLLQEGYAEYMTEKVDEEQETRIRRMREQQEEEEEQQQKEEEEAKRAAQLDALEQDDAATAAAAAAMAVAISDHEQGFDGKSTEAAEWDFGSVMGSDNNSDNGDEESRNASKAGISTGSGSQQRRNRTIAYVSRATVVPNGEASAGGATSTTSATRSRDGATFSVGAVSQLGYADDSTRNRSEVPPNESLLDTESAVPRMTIDGDTLHRSAGGDDVDGDDDDDGMNSGFDAEATNHGFFTIDDSSSDEEEDENAASGRSPTASPLGVVGAVNNPFRQRLTKGERGGTTVNRELGVDGVTRARRLVPLESFRRFYILETFLGEDLLGETYRVRQRGSKYHLAARFLLRDSDPALNAASSTTTATTTSTAAASSSTPEAGGKGQLMSAQMRDSCAIALVLNHPNLTRCYDLFYRSFEDAAAIDKAAQNALAMATCTTFSSSADKAQVHSRNVVHVSLMQKEHLGRRQSVSMVGALGQDDDDDGLRAGGGGGGGRGGGMYGRGNPSMPMSPGVTGGGGFNPFNGGMSGGQAFFDGSWAGGNGGFQNRLRGDVDMRMSGNFMGMQGRLREDAKEAAKRKSNARLDKIERLMSEDKVIAILISDLPRMRSLRAVPTGASPQALTNAAQCVRGVCSALQYMHRFSTKFSIVHGSVRAENTVVDAKGSVTLVGHTHPVWLFPRGIGDILTTNDDTSFGVPDTPDIRRGEVELTPGVKQSNSALIDLQPPVTYIPPELTTYMQQVTRYRMALKNAPGKDTGISGLNATIPYDTAVDMWAVGVTLYYYLFGYYPLTQEEIAIMLQRPVPGSPSGGGSGGTPHPEAEARELLKGLLTTDPRRRLTAEQVLSHPFLNRTF